MPNRTHSTTALIWCLEGLDCISPVFSLLCFLWLSIFQPPSFLSINSSDLFLNHRAVHLLLFLLLITLFPTVFPQISSPFRSELKCHLSEKPSQTILHSTVSPPLYPSHPRTWPHHYLFRPLTPMLNCFTHLHTHIISVFFHQDVRSLKAEMMCNLFAAAVPQSKNAQYMVDDKYL